MKRGEVWCVDFEPALGSEIRKMRPAVIVSNDAANRDLERVQAIPITSNVARLYTLFRYRANKARRQRIRS